MCARTLVSTRMCKQPVSNVGLGVLLNVTMLSFASLPDPLKFRPYLHGLKPRKHSCIHTCMHSFWPPLRLLEASGPDLVPELTFLILHHTHLIKVSQVFCQIQENACPHVIRHVHTTLCNSHISNAKGLSNLRGCWPVHDPPRPHYTFCLTHNKCHRSVNCWRTLAQT